MLNRPQELPQAYKILDDKLLLIGLIEKLITSIIQQTQALPPGPSLFNCKYPPKITISEYLKRIAKYSHCSTGAYVMALILIDRLQQRREGLVINKYNVHRLLICSLMIGVKWIDDFYYKNEYYAKIGGISCEEMNEMEMEMMNCFSFSVFISEDQFINYLQKLQLYQDININHQTINQDKNQTENQTDKCIHHSY